MNRRKFLHLSSLFGVVGSLSPTTSSAKQISEKAKAVESHPLSKVSSGTDAANDRKYWISLLAKIADPVLNNMSKGELRKSMQVEYSSIWDGRNKEVAYMEAFGRLLAGLAPFVALPDDDSSESKIRERMRLQVLQCLAHAVDKASPDYLYWGSPN